MELKRINGALAVSSQITAADVAEIAAIGIRAIICNRPDDEEPNQPIFGEIEAAAKEFGLEARYQPVVSGGVRDEDGRAFGVLLDDLPKPVLAYCRSGTRSTMLWALSERSYRPATR